jgi:HEAT repeat protein
LKLRRVSPFNNSYTQCEKEHLNMVKNDIQKHIETIIRGTGDDREEAVKSLGNIGPDAEEAVPTLIDAIKEDSLCWAAIAALGRIGGKAAMNALCDALLKDIDMGVRMRAATGLGTIGDKEAVPDLIKALADRNEYVRVAAASSLGEIGDQTANTALKGALKDPSKIVSTEAAKALDRIGEYG